MGVECVAFVDGGVLLDDYSVQEDTEVQVCSGVQAKPADSRDCGRGPCDHGGYTLILVIILWVGRRRGGWRRGGARRVTRRATRRVGVLWLWGCGLVVSRGRGASRVPVETRENVGRPIGGRLGRAC
jgi:hypothetical protein